jgi:peptidoglycan/LPS O-acetylase OafA/YrhL
MAASALYVENWMLLKRSVDYLAIDQAPSPLQHFWSLAVEEQFYLGWPLLMAGVAGWWRWRRRLDGNGFPSVGMAQEASPPRPPPARTYALPTPLLCALSFATAL